MCTLLRINECGVCDSSQFHLAIDAIESLTHSLSCISALSRSILPRCYHFCHLVFHFVVNGAVVPSVLVVVELLLLSLFVVFGFIYIVSVRLHCYRVFANFHPFKSFCTNCVCVCASALICCLWFNPRAAHFLYVYVFPKSERRRSARNAHCHYEHTSTYTRSMLVHTKKYSSVIQHWTDLNNIILLYCVLRLPVRFCCNFESQRSTYASKMTRITNAEQACECVWVCERAMVWSKGTHAVARQTKNVPHKWGYLYFLHIASILFL